MKLLLPRKSLHWRIAVPYALLILAMMGGIGLYISLSMRAFYIQQVSDRLLAEARLSSQDLAAQIAADPFSPSINEQAQRAAKAIDGRVTIILLDGTVAGESERPLEGMENHLGRPEVQAALDNQEAARTRFSTTLDQELLYAAVPVIWDGKVIAVVRLAYSLANLQNELNRLVGSIVLATAVAAAVAVLLAFVISTFTLRPLRALSTSVERFGFGLAPDLLPSRGTDEISQLQTTFRGMYDQLGERFNELRAERSKLEAVLMNMSDGLLIVNGEGSVSLLNPAAQRLFDAQGHPEGKPEVPSGQPSLIEIVRHHQVVELWRKCKLSGQPQSLTLEMTSGRSNLQVTATPLRQEMEGSVLLVFQDLTRIRRLETVRRDFISNVSHELRTPLASLKALTETLQEGALEDPPAARRFLSQMENEIDNLTQMVRELLELSRIESGRVPFQLKNCDPGELVAKAAERMRLQAERAGLELVIEIGEGLPEVLADADRIGQVIVNLVHNAVKFTLPGGKITAGCTPRDKEVQIYVRDSGVGIAPDELGRIFERFYKADRSRSGGGTGLGLSIARHVVESHGGRIWAESQVGRGSTFTFSLPKV
jgi:two-component system, OmpR family, phosphate regulon sensor histidine kinase PhoR